MVRLVTLHLELHLALLVQLHQPAQEPAAHATKLDTTGKQIRTYALLVQLHRPALEPAARATQLDTTGKQIRTYALLVQLHQPAQEPAAHATLVLYQLGPVVV